MANLTPWRSTGWNPFQLMDALQNEMRNMFNMTGARAPMWEDDAGRAGAFTPAIDVVEDPNGFHVIAEMPGLKKENIDVSLQGTTLVIRGEKKQEQEQKEKNGFLRTERMYGSFYRAIDLPQHVDPSKVDASYQDGILKVSLAKKEEAKPRQISVQVK